jgi:hypothetical protein
MINQKQKQKHEQNKAKKLYEIFSDRELDILLISLNQMENELASFPDKKMEFGPDLIINMREIEPIKDFVRYG